MGYERPRNLVLDRAVGLSRADRDRILHTNAAGMLRLT
jgi:predicted TIM-barrel fold metal-dependent hydrolase